MAGIGVGTSAGGRRRSLDAEINLVPFIDLLSMCISFLLLTAVWINIGAVQIKQSHGTEAAPVLAQQYEMDVKFLGPSSLEIQMKRGHGAIKHALKATTPQELIKQFDAGLALWNETKDSKNISSVKISPKTSASYGDLVNVMDVLRKHQIVNLAVLGGES